MALHPFIVALLEVLKDLPALSSGSPAEGRAQVAAGRARLGQGPAMALVRDRMVQGRAGDIPVRVLTPKAIPVGVIVFIHGGGWVLGALDDYDTYARSLADRSGCAVVMVGYRLAPEHRFPAGLEDCEDAISAVLQGKIAGIPKGPVVVLGDSAGANLATVCCARLADRSVVALQVLYYPVTDADFSRDSYDVHGRGLPLTAADMQWFFGQYAPQDVWRDPAISPLRTADLRGMPPAIVVTAEYDVLADEGAAYADQLAGAGVPVLRRCVAGVTHGFIRLHNLFDVADHELSTISSDIREAASQGDKG